MAKVAVAECCVDRTAVSTGLDDAIFTIHYTSDPAGSDLTHTQHLAFANKVKTFWSALTPYFSTTHALREVKAYELEATAPWRAHFVETNQFLPLPGVAGGSAGLLLPPQVACTVTLKTTSRKHWGRFYMPGLTGTQIDSTRIGQVKSGTVDAIAAAAKPLFDSGTGGCRGVVWSGSLGNTEGVISVQVDDVFDVQRRRRVKHSTYKAYATPS